MILENAAARPKIGSLPGILRGWGLAGILLLAQATGTAGYYEDAVHLFDRGDYAGALIQLRNAVQQDGAHLPARILLAGRAPAREPAPPPSRLFASRPEAGRPTWPRAGRNGAWSWRNSSREANPTDARIARLYASALARAGRSEAARKSTSVCPETNPTMRGS